MGDTHDKLFFGKLLDKDSKGLSHMDVNISK